MYRSNGSSGSDANILKRLSWKAWALILVVAAIVIGLILWFMGRLSIPGVSYKVTLGSPSIAQLATETFTVNGASSSGQVKLSWTFGTPASTITGWTLQADVLGHLVGTFQVGTNLPKGTVTFKVTDITTGKVASADMTVT